MDIIIAGSIVVIGVLFSKIEENNNNNNNIKKIRNNLLNNNNIYDSNNFNKFKKIEQNKVHKNFKKSFNAIDTNIIPKGFNQSILNSQTNSIKYLQRPENTRNTNNLISKLSGQKIEKFNHNNMVPFFGGSVKQNINEQGNKNILNLHTGSQIFPHSKKEVKTFFKPQKNINNVYGTTLNTSTLLNRYVASNKKTKEKPFESIYVGPALNKGYNSKPSGGFGHNNMREFIIPKKTNQLRTINNQKLSYKSRIITGKSLTVNRTKIGKIENNKPNTFGIHGPEKYFTTVGANTKGKMKSKILIKETNRKKSKSYKGSKAPVHKNQTQRGNYVQSIKNIFKTNGPRNVNLNNKWNKSDYGKKSIKINNNQRTESGVKTHITNLTSIVKALVAPIQDVFRHSKKELSIENKTMGNINSMPIKKHTVWDPNNVARTTIKETNIHNKHTGNLTSYGKLTIYDPNDIARTTIKETNINNNHSGNLTGHNKSIIYDPNDVARTTIKETNIHNNHNGNLTTNNKGFIYDPNDVARTTIKETNINNNRIGNINNLDGLKGGYNKDTLNIINTNRQFSSKEYTGIMNGKSENGNNGYLTNPKNMPNTNRQLSHKEYTGTCNSNNNKPRSYEDIYNLTLNELKESTLVNRTPTIEKKKIYINKDNINITTKKTENNVTRQLISDKIYSNMNNKINITKFKKSLNNEKIINRINSSTLKAFKENPYSKPLDSYVFN